MSEEIICCCAVTQELNGETRKTVSAQKMHYNVTETSFNRFLSLATDDNSNKSDDATFVYWEKKER